MLKMVKFTNNKTIFPRHYFTACLYIRYQCSRTCTYVHWKGYYVNTAIFGTQNIFFILSNLEIMVKSKVDDVVSSHGLSVTA